MSLPTLPSPLGPTTPPTGPPSSQSGSQPTTTRNYLVIPLVLQPQMEIDVSGDWFSLVSYEADLDLSNVYVAFNYADNWLPLNAIAPGVFTPFERVYIRAAQSEVGKSLSIAIGGQARFYVASQNITIGNDLVGLAREYTLAQISTSAAGVYAIASSNVNYPLSTMAATLSGIESNSANINAVVTSNVNVPLSSVQNTLNGIEANATSINRVVTANVNYPLSTMAATLSSIESNAANINAVVTSNVNVPLSNIQNMLNNIETNATNMNAAVSANVNYPLSTMAATLNSIESNAANINAILTTNVNAPLSGIQTSLINIEANATSISAAVSANVNYPLSAMATTLNSIESNAASINAILTTNVNTSLSNIANALNAIETSATSINNAVSANINYPLSTMASTLNSVNSYSANINGILSSNVNFPMNQLRWGYPVEPIWTYSAVSTGPLAAGTVLLSQPVSSGYNAYIWGYFLSENDPNGNVFLIQWVNGTTVHQQMIVMNGPGTINFIAVKAVNDGIPASPNTTMAIKILNAASTNALYMAGILYGQVV